MYGDDHTTADEIWNVLVSRMKPGTWYHLEKLYEFVSEGVVLTKGDHEPDAPGSESPRWRRNVRNVLQRRKTGGDLDWERWGNYRLPLFDSSAL